MADDWKSVVTKNVLGEATGPQYAEHGVPHCTDDLCVQFDGKRCRLLRDPKFYTARTKRAVNSGGAL